MPRIRQKECEYAMKDLVAEIKAECARRGLDTQTDIGRAIGVCQSTAGEYLRNPTAIKLGILRNIVKVIHPNPIIILKALGYTPAEIRKLRGSVIDMEIANPGT